VPKSRFERYSLSLSLGMAGVRGIPIFTVGHSTHSIIELVELLRRNDIACLIDVRSAPRSRRLPHFHKEALERTLPEQKIGYLHIAELGGFRRPRSHSPNSAWRNRGFQGYADYMLTPEFERALENLCRLARERRTAFMCAEGLWWRCHRRFIADVLSVRGWRVRHIDPRGTLEEHRLPGFAVVVEGRLTYPPTQEELPLDRR
jgi:uncharacterized protein (DUF488 family)